MAPKKRKKVRVALRKKSQSRARRNVLTREILDDGGFPSDDLPAEERVSGKGDLTRRRTVMVEDESEGGPPVLEVDESQCRRGRVLWSTGLTTIVQGDDGVRYQCAVRRLLRKLATDARNAVVAGDRAVFQPADGEGESGAGRRSGGKTRSRGDTKTGRHEDRRLLPEPALPEPSGAAAGTHPETRPAESSPLPARPSSLPQGVVLRVEPRHGVVARLSGRREHVLVANVDQVLIVVSAADPPLKPGLIDRFLISAEKGGVRSVICINKADLVDPAALQPVAGLYGRLGYDVLLTSGTRGIGVPRLRALLHGRASAVTGQSGVGKSSLLNAVQPGLGLRTASVSEWTGKGRHTTRRAELLELEFGGWVVDTPGIRQFGLWDVLPEEVEGHFVEFRPFVTRCRFPDCTHTHETGCGIKQAVDHDLISRLRYESYLRIVAGEPEE